MASYILSDANRFYVAKENGYGIAAPVGAANRFAAFSFDCHQATEIDKRSDKTGSRTYLGPPSTGIRHSSFDLTAHLTSWDGDTEPCYGPLFESAMGASPLLVQGLVVAAVNGGQIQTQSPHGLFVGAAVSNGVEIRFLTKTVDALTFDINTPFSVNPGVGSMLATTLVYRLANQLPSVSIYDYWDPVWAISRLVAGACVNKCRISVKGDQHELRFSGPAANVMDSVSGSFGKSGLAQFPLEPPTAAFEYSIVDGQLGQVWLGSPLNQVFALTEASIEIDNNLLLRNREFGSSYPAAVVPSGRQVVSSFSLFAQPDAVTQSLYAAAKLKTPIPALLQLGQQRGRMMAIYLPNVMAELPFFDDSEPFLIWEFKNSLGQGVSNDEAFLAFA